MYRNHSITVTAETDCSLRKHTGIDSLAIAQRTVTNYQAHCIGDCALRVVARPIVLREADTWPDAIAATTLRATCANIQCPDTPKAEKAVVAAIYDTLRLL